MPALGDAAEKLRKVRKLAVWRSRDEETHFTLQRSNISHLGKKETLKSSSKVPGWEGICDSSQEGKLLLAVPDAVMNW